MVRRGVFGLLSVEEDIEIVGEAGTAGEALIRIPATRPDVAVLDVRLAGGSGGEVCREVRSQDDSVTCLVPASSSGDEALFDAITAGASGYCSRRSGAASCPAPRDVAAGRSLPDPVATARVLERLRDGRGTGGDERLSRLTEQERSILDLIGEGLTNRATGERLHPAEKTIRNHAPGLPAKLGMERRSQTAAYVARLQAERRA